MALGYRIFLLIISALLINSQCPEYAINKTVISWVLNPAGFISEDARFSTQVVPLEASASSITKMTICAWIYPTKSTLESVVIIGLFSPSKSNPRRPVKIKVNGSKLMINTNTAKKGNIKSWQWTHICAWFSDKKSKVYVNKIEEVLPDLDQSFYLEKRFLTQIGADNTFEYGFSGYAADVQIRESALSNANIKDIYELKSITAGANLWEESTEPDGDKEKFDNDQFKSEEEVKESEIDGCELFRIPPNYNVITFTERESCESAIEICNSFGGRLPIITETDDLLSDLLIDTEVKTFWITKTTTDLNPCHKGTFNVADGKVTANRGTGSKIPFVCLIPIDMIFYLKLSELETYEFQLIPNTQLTFESRDWQIYVDKRRVSFDNPSYGIKVKSIMISSTKNLVGRLTWSGRGPEGIETAHAIFSVCTEGQFTCSNGICINIDKVCNYREDCRDGSDEEFCEAAMVPEGFYDKRLASANDNNMELSLVINFERLVKVKMEDNAVVFIISLDVAWRDHRLKFKYLLTDGNETVLDPSIANHFWHPRINFGDAVSEDKKAFYLNESPGRIAAKRTTVGKYEVIQGYEVLSYEGQDVDIVHSKEKEMEIVCQMDLFLHPFDKQICIFSLTLEGILINDAKWKKSMVTAVIKEKKELSLFSNLEFTAEPSASNDNEVLVTFSVTRKYGAYLFNIFLPCLIMEFLGLITLLMPNDNYQNRVGVTLSCLIVVAALFIQVSTSLPTSAAPKLVDIWMFVHVGILFLVFMVHVVVIYYHYDETQAGKLSKKKNKRKKKSFASANDFAETFTKNNKVWNTDNGKKEADDEENSSYPFYAKVNMVGLLVCTLIYLVFLGAFSFLVIKGFKVQNSIQ